MVILYRYRPNDDKTLKPFQKGYIWCPKPISFNDPFDCKPALITTKDKDLIKLRKKQIVLYTLMKLQHSIDSNINIARFSKKEKERIISEIMQIRSWDKQYSRMKKIFGENPFKIQDITERDIRDSIKKKLNEIGVVCLSEVSDNLLMWSHYTNNHKGFCLGFEFNKIPTQTSTFIIQPVNYVKTYPYLDIYRIHNIPEFGLTQASTKIHFDFLNRNIVNVIYTKSKSWKYEKEWRIVYPTGGIEIDSPGQLSEIIIGLRCNEKDKKLITRAAQRINPSIKIKKIVTKPRSYRLEVVEL